MRTSNIRVIFIACLSGLLPGLLAAQTHTAALGGRGGADFQLQCPQYAYLVGFRAYIGDDMDAVSPVCAPATQAGRGAPLPMDRIAFAGTIGPQSLVESVCPDAARAPFVRKLEVHAEGTDLYIVSGIRYWCGTASGPPLEPSYTARGPNARRSGGRSVFSGSSWVDSFNSVSCPAGLVAAGIHGKAGEFVDALGLSCSPLAQQPRSEVAIAGSSATAPLASGSQSSRAAAQSVAPPAARIRIAGSARPASPTQGLVNAPRSPTLENPARNSPALAATAVEPCANVSPPAGRGDDLDSRIERLRCEYQRMSSSDRQKLAQRLDDVVLWSERQR